MSERETKKTPATWMRNLLLGSAALNVFLAGFLFAKFLGTSEIPEDLTTPTINLGALPPDLPPRIREEFENNFRVHRRNVEENYEDLFQARIKIQDLMGMVDLDEEALNKALEEIRGLQIEIQGSIHATMVETLRDMDPELRQIFILGGDQGLEKGIWSQRRFDGVRWKVDIENGEIKIDFRGIARDPEDDEDNFSREE